MKRSSIRRRRSSHPGCSIRRPLSRALPPGVIDATRRSPMTEEEREHFIAQDRLDEYAELSWIRSHAVAKRGQYANA